MVPETCFYQLDLLPVLFKPEKLLSKFWELQENNELLFISESLVKSSLCGCNYSVSQGVEQLWNLFLQLN